MKSKFHWPYTGTISALIHCVSRAWNVRSAFASTRNLPLLIILLGIFAVASTLRATTGNERPSENRSDVEGDVGRGGQMPSATDYQHLCQGRSQLDSNLPTHYREMLPGACGMMNDLKRLSSYSEHVRLYALLIPTSDQINSVPSSFLRELTSTLWSLDPSIFDFIETEDHIDEKALHVSDLILTCHGLKASEAVNCTIQAGTPGNKKTISRVSWRLGDFDESTRLYRHQSIPEQATLFQLGSDAIEIAWNLGRIVAATSKEHLQKKEEFINDFIGQDSASDFKEFCPGLSAGAFQNIATAIYDALVTLTVAGQYAVDDLGVLTHADALRIASQFLEEGASPVSNRSPSRSGESREIVDAYRLGLATFRLQSLPMATCARNKMLSVFAPCASMQNGEALAISLVNSDWMRPFKTILGEYDVPFKLPPFTCSLASQRIYLRHLEEIEQEGLKAIRKSFTNHIKSEP